MTTRWNPRYEAYARAHWRSPEAMLAFDEEHYPGGKMAGFCIWISRAWDAFNDYALEEGLVPPRYARDQWCARDYVRLALRDVDARFDAWLWARVGGKP